MTDSAAGAATVLLCSRRYSIDQIRQRVGGYVNGGTRTPVPVDATATLEQIPIGLVAHLATPLDHPHFTDDRDYTHDLGQAMLAGDDKVPPVVLHRRGLTYATDDGWHRISAAVHYDVPHVTAFVFDLSRSS